jgi:SpoVK/Ycf46/Vps4 family AAA+-type ATPase
VQTNIRTFKVNNSNLFDFSHYYQFVNFYELFLNHFSTIPNVILVETINPKKAADYFIEKYKHEILEKFFMKSSHRETKKLEINEYYFVLNNLIIVFSTDENQTYFLCSESNIEKTNEIISELSQFKKKSTRTDRKISLLISTMRGIEIESLKITKPKLKIQDNYNEDFLEIHQTILKRLSKSNDKGIVLLHGKPGTGKTSYIRYLITILKKQVIFLPPNMAVAITDPNFLSVLIENPNSIFVIEDAENIVMDRNQNGASAVSTLLNLSDGLLSDCLNIQIICSFNTDISKIDSALLRKGRLIAKYEFKALEIAKAQQLSNKLGFKNNINQPTILTEVYNPKEQDFKESKKGIGFGNK